MLVAPWRQHLAFSFGSSVGGSGDLDDIRHTERLQLANLPCGRILVRGPRRMNSWSSQLGGSEKTATRDAIPFCTRSAASRAPAPPESSDTTIMSAGAIHSSTTSAQPAARRTGVRTEGIAIVIAATNATTTNWDAVRPPGAHALSQGTVPSHSTRGRLGEISATAGDQVGPPSPCWDRLGDFSSRRARLFGAVTFLQVTAFYAREEIEGQP